MKDLKRFNESKEDEKLDILDAMGQRSVISFEYFEANPKNLSPSQFVFVPPKGVDVVRP